MIALGPALLIVSLALVSARSVAQRESSIELVVLEPGGAPATRVAVAVREAGGESGATPEWTWREAKEGRITIGGLEASRAVAVRLRTEASAVATTRAILPGGPPSTVKLEPGRAVRGIVVDAETGAPVALATAVAVATSGDPSALVEAATTGADGTFTLLGVPASARSVRVSAPNRAPKSAPLGDEPIRISMESRGAETQKMRFDGPPVPGETWRLLVERPGVSAEAAVDASGAFELPALPPGRYDAVLLRSSESEGWTWRFWVAALAFPSRQARPITLRNALFPGEVRARVVRAGAPAPGVPLRAYPLGTTQSPAVTGRTASDGVARLPNLQKARTWIAVDGTLAGAFCDVPESGLARAEIEIPSGRAAIRLLEEGTSSPIPGAMVRLAHDDGKGTPDVPPVPPLEARTDENGVARFESLPPGTFVSEAGTEDGLLATGRARLTIALGAAEASAEVRAVRAGVVAGSAFRNGAPIDDAVRLVLRDTGTGRQRVGTTSFDGSFRFASVAAGRHPLFAFGGKNLFSDGVIAVDTILGATKIVDLELVPGGTLDVRVESADKAKLRRLRVVAEPKREGEMPPWTDLVSVAERNDFLRAQALDPSGRTRVGPAPPGRYRVRAIAPDGAVLASDDATIAAGTTTAVTLKAE